MIFYKFEIKNLRRLISTSMLIRPFQMFQSKFSLLLDLRK